MARGEIGGVRAERTDVERDGASVVGLGCV